MAETVEKLQESISVVWNNINRRISKYNNELLLFDFTTVSHNNKGVKIRSIYQHKIDNYNNILNEYFQDNGYSIPSNTESEPILFSCKKDCQTKIITDTLKRIYAPSGISETPIVELETWHQFVNKTGIAGQCWTLFKYFFKQVAFSYPLEVGVYLLFKNRFQENNSQAINDLVSSEVYKFIWDKGVEFFGGKYLEKINEIQELKSKTTFSLTTHSLKTHLNTSIIKEKNTFLNQLERKDDYQELIESYKNFLSVEIDKLYQITDILSLVDKLHNKEKFTKLATERNLLSSSKPCCNLLNLKNRYNEFLKEEEEPIIEIVCKGDLSKFSLPFKVYDLYFDDILIELFFNTLFENIVQYGDVEDNYTRILKIEECSNKFIFSNQSRDKTLVIDDTNLTGNFKLFQKLIEDSNSGTFSVPSIKDYLFKIEIKYGKQD